MSQPEMTLHVWPGRWNLPSIDPTCLAAIMHLHLVLPGHFIVAECVNPDLSPSGQLPFLTHENQVVTSLPSIVKYGTSLKSLVTQDKYLSRDIDAPLSALEKSQSVAWCAHTESKLADLAAHMFYSLDANWSNLTHTVLSSMLPIPQRYYVPGRIRDSYRPRLEASGLWNLPGVEEEKGAFKETKKPEIQDRNTKYVKVFEREKTLEKGRLLFDIYKRLLGGRKFFYHDRPTTLDIALAAHLLLLIDAPFPEPLLQTLLTESYPSLVVHARSVQAEAIPPSEAGIRSLPPRGYTLRSLIPWQKAGPPGRAVMPEAKNDADIWFDRLRWGWIGLAVSGVIIYLLNSDIRIQVMVEEDPSQEGIREAVDEEILGEGAADIEEDIEI